MMHPDEQFRIRDMSKHPEYFTQLAKTALAGLNGKIPDSLKCYEEQCKKKMIPNTMNPKHLLDELVDINQTREDIYKQLNAFMSDLFKRYIAIEYKDQNHYGIPNSFASIDSWDLDEGDIEIQWSDNWRYGGHDEGVVIIPIELIYEHHFQEYEDSKTKQRKCNEEDKQVEQRKRDEQKFKELKQKLNK